jgi:hypothetical protein
MAVSPCWVYTPPDRSGVALVPFSDSLLSRRERVVWGGAKKWEAANSALFVAQLWS